MNNNEMDARAVAVLRDMLRRLGHEVLHCSTDETGIITFDTILADELRKLGYDREWANE